MADKFFSKINKTDRVILIFLDVCILHLSNYYKNKYNTMKLKKCVRVLLILLLIGAFTTLIVLKYINTPNIDYSNTKPDNNLTYTALLTEAKVNDTSTIKKYTNKLIAVSGPVKEIKNDSSGYVLQIGDKADLSSIVCQMDNRHNNDFTALKPGQTITIKGKITGANNDELLGTTIEMNFCILDK